MQDPLDWSSVVAQRVCTLVRDERVLERFRAQCAAFLDEKRRDEEQLAAWERRRKEYCLRGLHTLAELKARMEESERLGNDRDEIERTRPAEDTDKTLVFDYYQDFLDSDDLARLGSPENGSMLIAFCVWVPPHLCVSASPKLTVPPLFGRFTGHLHSPHFGRTIEPGRASWAELDFCPFRRSGFSELQQKINRFGVLKHPANAWVLQKSAARARNPCETG